MTNNEINIAIAEACGWTNIHTDTDTIGVPVLCGEPKPKLPLRAVPNYCTDLNAMHEAEKHITIGDQWNAYYFHFVDADGVKINATARQRAESFLITVGKWKE